MPDTVKVSGDDYTNEQIRRLAVQLADLRGFWPLVVPVFIGWMRQQFETQGAFGGRRWAPLSPDYAAWKQRHAPGKGLLVFSGGIRQAASRPTRTATPRALTLTIDDSTFGHGPRKVKRPILQHHQAGGGRLPARPLVFGSPLPPAAAAEMDAVGDRYVHDLLRRL